MTVQSTPAVRRIVQFVAALGVFAALAIAMPQSAHAKGDKAASATETKFHGKVTAVTATSITVHNKKDNKDETLAVSPTTKVKVEKVAAAISDVTVGMHAELVTVDGTTAKAVHAHTGKEKTKAPK